MVFVADCNRSLADCTPAMFQYLAQPHRVICTNQEENRRNNRRGTDIPIVHLSQPNVMRHVGAHQNLLAVNHN